LANQTDFVLVGWVVREEVFDSLACLIGRPVVDDENFLIDGKLVGKWDIQEFSQDRDDGRLFVISRYKNGDFHFRPAFLLRRRRVLQARRVLDCLVGKGKRSFAS